MRKTVSEWAGSKYGFYVDRTWQEGKWRRAKGPIKLASYHARILDHVFALDADGRAAYDTIAWCEPAKSGKTAVNALAHEFFALHVDPPAEQFVLANKRDQAQSRAFTALCQSVRWNPHLGSDPDKYELTFKNGTKITAAASNYRTESGSNFTLASFDEPWAIMYEDSVRLVSEFKPDPTRTVSCRLFTGYAGFTGESEFWADLLESGLEGEPVPELRDIGDGRGRPACWRNGRTFVFWSHEPRQPWQTREWIASLEATLTPNEFRRLVYCDFSQNEASYIQPEWWAACQGTVPDLDEKTPVVLAVDASVSGDCSAIVAVSRHPDDNNAVMIRKTYIFNPAQQLGREIVQSETLEPTLRALIAAHNIICVTYDEFQLAKLAQDLSRELGVWFRPFSQQNERLLADTALRQMIIQRKITHDGNPLLAAHFAAAAAKVTGEGSKLRIVKKNRNPVDGAVAVSMGARVALYLNL